MRKDETKNPFMGYYDLSWKEYAEAIGEDYGVSVEEVDVRGGRLAFYGAGNKSAFWRELGKMLNAAGIKHAF